MKSRRHLISLGEVGEISVHCLRPVATLVCDRHGKFLASLRPKNEENPKLEQLTRKQFALWFLFGHGHGELCCGKTLAEACQTLCFTVKLSCLRREKQRLKSMPREGS